MTRCNSRCRRAERRREEREAGKPPLVQRSVGPSPCNRKCQRDKFREYLPRATRRLVWGRWRRYRYLDRA